MSLEFAASRLLIPVFGSSIYTWGSLVGVILAGLSLGYLRPGYSAFTGALLDILGTEMDPDNDGILTASEIGFNLEREVFRQRQTEPYQRPIYSHLSGSRGGDFIFKIFHPKY
jgi:hypothetical protein